MRFLFKINIKITHFGPYYKKQLKYLKVRFTIDFIVNYIIFLFLQW